MGTGQGRQDRAEHPKSPERGELTPSYAWHERNINRKHKATGNSTAEVSPFIEALFLLALSLCLLSVKSIRFLTLLRPWVGKIYILPLGYGLLYVLPPVTLQPGNAEP